MKIIIKAKVVPYRGNIQNICPENFALPLPFISLLVTDILQIPTTIRSAADKRKLNDNKYVTIITTNYVKQVVVTRLIESRLCSRPVLLNQILDSAHVQ